ncbi:AraC family transcriptional regulator [Vitiosangium sp. GDMCC 1.1324]|uniref:AraC family transcriptional regulator n=1 Tax=Vitiosangium sp. (strain GDMCC 1.1324) TaxID=2138576 RepID=UPI000D34E531|nr:AraC family transcriptional regulator [Vitiosangium sp. GDMCC 1.1324]PTL79405.1 AraC family transcriptional regulator [Vitiosangium sp. GDMCC 1.1324]
MTDRMKQILTLLWVAALAVGGTSASAADDKKKGLPEGWFVTESAPKLYEAGLDTQSPCEGNRSAYLRSLQASPSGYGTFMQAFGAQTFRGKRLRFSAEVRTEDVQGWTGLWMRVEGEDPKEPLAFDNMQSRAVVGTTPCKRYEVVLDVPQESKAIMAGLMLSGTGKAWIGAVRFETVDASVPVTNLIANRPQRRLPAGRIGEAWFNAEKVDAGMNRWLPQLDGSWKDNVSSALTLNGNTVQGTLAQKDLNVVVRAGGPSTLIQGVWGSDQVFIELGAEKLVMKWGIYSRELVREEGRPREDGTCIRYRNPTGIGMSDYLDVCGVALSKSPPSVPLVVAFFYNGFRSVSAARGAVQPPIAPMDRISAPPQNR